MRDLLSVDRIANQIRLRRSIYSGTFLLVEGSSDKTNKNNAVKISTSTIDHYHNGFFDSLNLSHSNQNFIILAFLVILLVLLVTVKPFLWWMARKLTGEKSFSDTIDNHMINLYLSGLSIIVSIFLVVTSIIVSILIVGQTAIMISGVPGNVISNSHFFDPTEVVSEDKNKAEKISTTTIDPYHNDLPIDTRKKIYREYNEKESEAREEAVERYPTSPDFSDSINLSHIISPNNYIYEKRNIYIKKCKMTSKQMTGIFVEGDKEGW